MFGRRKKNLSEFKTSHSLSDRLGESERIRARYPDRVPVICEKDSRTDIEEIDKKKYLVPQDLTVGHFIQVVRKRLKLDEMKAMFLFVNQMLPPSAQLMTTLYEEQKDEDGFLYITYSSENTFG